MVLNNGELSNGRGLGEGRTVSLHSLFDAYNQALIEGGKDPVSYDVYLALISPQPQAGTHEENPHLRLGE